MANLIKVEENVGDGVIVIKDEERDDDNICELEHLRKLFIGGLAPYTTEEGLRNFYGQWGKVVDVVVMRDPATKRSRGFGFITYTKSSMVDKAQENRPHIIDGKTVEAKRALPRPERESRETNISVKKLFVGGLKDNHDEECLQEYFSQFGKVVSTKILTDKTTGKRRGFAFIEFDDYDAVDKAILQKNHSIKYVVVDVKKSVYNQEQQSRQQNNGAVGKNMPQAKPPTPVAGAPSPGYRQPPPQGAVPYNQPPPMHPGHPPPNYNYWGPTPPPAMPPQYGGYPQPPPTHMNTWSYPQAPPPQSWNAGPPPPPANWYPNQWGYPPPAGPPPTVPQPGAMPPPANTWSAPPAAPPSVVPPGTANNMPPQQQQPPPNFGTGYQQSYASGPIKHNMNGNRMNPYGPPQNNYVNPAQPPAAPYGGYNAGPPNGKPGPPAPLPNVVINPMTNGGGSASAAAGGKYRR